MKFFRPINFQIYFESMLGAGSVAQEVNHLLRALSSKPGTRGKKKKYASCMFVNQKLTAVFLLEIKGNKPGMVSCL
jgi:hypothetical protein